MKKVFMFFAFSLTMMACEPVSSTSEESGSCSHGGPSPNLVEPVQLDNGAVVSGLWVVGKIDDSFFPRPNRLFLRDGTDLFFEVPFRGGTLSVSQEFPFSISSEMETCNFFASLYEGNPDLSGTVTVTTPSDTVSYQAVSNHFDLVQGEDVRFFTSLMDFGEHGYVEIQFRYQVQE